MIGSIRFSLESMDSRFLQYADPNGTTLIDARNGFNEMSLLATMWNVRHRWPARARFAFNFYRHWAQLLLRHPGYPPVISMSQEGVTQGDPLLMVLYGITLTPLAEELRASYSGLLPPFYADNAVFDDSTQQSAQLLKLLKERVADRGNFPYPDKSLFILDTLGKEEAVRREFAAEGLELNFVSGIRYLGAYLGPQEELAAWVKP